MMRSFHQVMIAALLVALPLRALERQPERLSGIWKGSLKTPKGELSLFLSIRPQLQGGFSGDLAVPEQGLRGLKLVGVRQEDVEVSFSVPEAQAHYSGRINKDTIEGVWKQPLGSVAYPARSKALRHARADSNAKTRSLVVKNR